MSKALKYKNKNIWPRSFLNIITPFSVLMTPYNPSFPTSLHRIYPSFRHCCYPSSLHRHFPSPRSVHRGPNIKVKVPVFQNLLTGWITLRTVEKGTVIVPEGVPVINHTSFTMPLGIWEFAHCWGTGFRYHGGS